MLITQDKQRRPADQGKETKLVVESMKKSKKNNKRRRNKGSRSEEVSNIQE